MGRLPDSLAGAAASPVGEVAVPAAVPLPAPPPAALACPLSEAHFVVLRRAAADRRVVVRAAGTANASGACTLVLAALAAPFAVFSFSAIGCGVMAALALIGTTELLGGRRIRRADPSAPLLLGLNQLALLAVILAYCAMQMLSDQTTASVHSVLAGQQGMQDLEQQIAQWTSLLTYGMYIGIAVLSLAMQGGLALYYFSRRRHIDAFRRNTPPWIQRLLAEAGA